MLTQYKNTRFISGIAAALLLAGCGAIPSSGPGRSAVADAAHAAPSPGAAGIQIVDVTDAIAHQLYAGHQKAGFASTLGGAEPFRQQFGLGDVLEVSIWEAPPAMLFATAGSASRQTTEGGLAAGSQATVLPGQMIDASGQINVPFVGPVRAAGQTAHEVEAAIAQGLRGKAHMPQVLVRLAHNANSYVTVVGDVTTSTRMPLSPRGERLLDALAAAGGVRQPVDKMTIQVTRGDKVEALPLQTLIKDPKQNVALRSGDVVTALFQPLSFTALGASGKNEEINFEAQGITLAQALARSGGLNDSRADAQGVFIFRFEDAGALAWPTQPVRTTAAGKVPVVYRLDLKNPASFFAAQTFQMSDKDLLYVSNAPVAELQKFLNVVFSVVYPVASSINTFK
ncbi:polysaccharide biosynthesis/export family protein [Paraburkholderia bonniea]|uniref:polysaccharide biosynthesis/export family protein n=1 Tax=Paraburkholderia bonniea TaxID=2152891 RepID=UPI0012915F42|nr:polysaccharide biosynthesis/export family protein [Paraburkholderia bonniea]